MEMNLETTSCTVRGVNNRVEKHGEEERVIGMDVDVSVQVPVEILAAMELDDVDPARWVDWLYDDEGVPRELGLKPLQFTREFEGHRVVFRYRRSGKQTERKLTDAKIKKFKAEPVFKHSLTLSFQVQLHPQAPDTMGWLVEMMVHEASIEIEAQQRDAFDSSQAA